MQRFNRGVTRRLSLLLVILLLVSQPAFAMGSINKGHWAYDTMISLAKDRVFSPVTLDWGLDQPISRAAFVRLVNKAYGNEVEETVTFTDVSEDSIYYKDISKAVASGFINGYPDGTFRPVASISRQEVSAVLSKLTRKEDVLISVVNAFDDGTDVPEWSRESVAWMVQRQYMSGYPDGTLKFDKAVTYAEALTIVSNILGERVVAESVDGDGRVINGNVSVLDSGVTISNMEINGDLMIGGQVGDGDVTLDNVKVNGRLIVYGGGDNSIHLLRTFVKQLVVNRLEAPVRIVADEDSQVTDSVVETSSIMEAPPEVTVFKTVVIQPVIINLEIDLNGTFDTVTLKETPALVKAKEKAKAKAEAAGVEFEEQSVQIKIPLGAIIRNLAVEQKAEIKGLGKIVKAAIKANDVQVDVNTDEFELDEKVVKVKVKDKEVTTNEQAEQASGGKVNAGGSGGGSGGSSSSGGSSKDDDDTPTVTPGSIAFTSATASVTEGDDAVLALTRTGGSWGSVAVSYSVTTDSAISADLGSPTSGTVTFASGVTSANITIPTAEDTDDEPDEIFTVTLSNPTNNAALGTTKVATVTIEDDDDPVTVTSPGAIQFTSAVALATEGSSNIVLTLSRTNGADGDVTVPFTVANTTAEDADYTLPSPQSVTFTDSVTTQTLTITVEDDELVEDPESFIVTLTTPTGGATLASSNTQATATIYDNAGIIEFDTTSIGVTEGGSSNNITITRTGGTGDVTVNYSAAITSGSAVTGEFTPVSGQVTFTELETSKTVSVSAESDNTTTPEGDEVFRFTLGSITGEAALGSNTTKDVTITDVPTVFTLDGITSSGSAITVDFSDYVVLQSTSGGAIAVTSGPAIVASPGSITVDNIQFDSGTDNSDLILTLSEDPYTDVEITFYAVITSDEAQTIVEQTWKYSGTTWSIITP